MITFRLSDEEYEEVIKKSQDNGFGNVSAYIRACIKEKGEIRLEKQRDRILSVLKKIEVNIRQIAARQESGLFFVSDQSRLISQIEEMKNRMEEYQNENGHAGGIKKTGYAAKGKSDFGGDVGR